MLDFYTWNVIRTLGCLLLLLQNPPLTGTSPIDRALQLYSNHDYNAAISILEGELRKSGKLNPQYQEAVLTLGQSYFMLAQAPKAIPWLEKANPTNESLYMLGYAYLQANQPAKSEEAFAQLFQTNPTSAAGHLMAAQMMLKKDYDDAAADQLSAALRLNPNLPEAHFLLGEVDLFRGRVEEGIREILAELALNPNHAKAWYRLGEAQSRQEQWATAIPNLQRAVWLNPEYSGPLIVLGKCYLKLNNLSNAEGILRRATALDPQNQQANYLLGQTLIAEGKKEEGRALLERFRNRSN